jgi:hypothetical protein
VLRNPADNNSTIYAERVCSLTTPPGAADVQLSKLPNWQLAIACASADRWASLIEDVQLTLPRGHGVAEPITWMPGKLRIPADSDQHSWLKPITIPV